MAAVAAIIGSAVLGAGVNLAGQSEQSSASSAANTANQQAQAAQNQSAWNNYLLTRGVNANGAAPTGVVPTSGTTPVNTKLPLWANVNVSQPGTPGAWTKGPTNNSPTMTLAGSLGGAATPTSPAS